MTPGLGRGGGGEGTAGALSFRFPAQNNWIHTTCDTGQQINRCTKMAGSVWRRACSVGVNLSHVVNMYVFTTCACSSGSRCACVRVQGFHRVKGFGFRQRTPAVPVGSRNACAPGTQGGTGGAGCLYFSFISFDISNGFFCSSPTYHTRALYCRPRRQSDGAENTTVPRPASRVLSASRVVSAR